MIVLPEVDELKKLLQQMEMSSFLQKHLLTEMMRLAGQEFNRPEGLALVLLTMARTSLRKSYGSEKSIGSIEGCGLVGNILPKYIRVLIPDEQVASRVIEAMGPQMIALV